MKISFFLAKVLGLYLVVLGIYWATQQDRLQKACKELFACPALMTITGLSSVLFGLFILILHPVFEWDFRLLITLLFGILPILKGLMRLFVLCKEPHYCKGLIHGNKRIAIGIIVLLIGVFLTYSGFSA